MRVQKNLTKWRPKVYQSVSPKKHRWLHVKKILHHHQGQRVLKVSVIGLVR